MNKNFYYRILLVVTFIVGFLFIGSVPEATKTINWILFGSIFFCLYGITYKSFKGLSKEQIDEILFVNQLKKYGIDINEE